MNKGESVFEIKHTHTQMVISDNLSHTDTHGLVNEIKQQQQQMNNPKDRQKIVERNRILFSNLKSPIIRPIGLRLKTFFFHSNHTHNESIEKPDLFPLHVY